MKLLQIKIQPILDILQSCNQNGRLYTFLDLINASALPCNMKMRIEQLLSEINFQQPLLARCYRQDEIHHSVLKDNINTMLADPFFKKAVAISDLATSLKYHLPEFVVESLLQCLRNIKDQNSFLTSVQMILKEIDQRDLDNATCARVEEIVTMFYK